MNITMYFINFLIIVVFQIVILHIIAQFVKSDVKCNKKMILFILSSSLVEMFLTYKFAGAINAIICIIYFVLICNYLFKLKLKEILYYFIMIWLMGSIVDIAIMLIVDIVTSNMLLVKTNVSYIKPICSLAMMIILMVIFKLDLTKSLVEKLYKNLNVSNLSFLILLFILIVYILLDIICVIYLDNPIMIFILLCTFIMVSLYTVYVAYSKYEINTLKQTNALLIRNNQAYSKIIDDYRIFKHNIINQLLGIKSVSNKKSKILIDSLIKEYNDKFLINKNLKDVPSGLTGLVYEKILNFNDQELNISVNNKLNHDIFNLISPRSYNLLCEALGVLIDNALEASCVSNDKIIYLQFLETNDNINIKIINSFSGVLDLERLGTINYSSKSKGHGLGLYSIFGRSKIKVKTNIKNNLFCNEIIVKKKN